MTAHAHAALWRAHAELQAAYNYEYRFWVENGGVERADKETDWYLPILDELHEVLISQ